MNKHITSRIALLGFTGIALVASLFLQGCGQTDENSFITGPTAMSERPGDLIQEDYVGIHPIAPPARPALHLISPNGGEELVQETMSKIAWECIKEASFYNLYLSGDGGKTYEPIAEGLAAGSCLYEWKIASTASDLCLVKVEAKNLTGLVMEDVSDKPFRITAPRVDSGGIVMSERLGVPYEDDVLPIRPIAPCQRNHTAEVSFNNTTKNTYSVIVNEQEQGLLMPLGNLLVTVAEGDVKWHLYGIPGDGKPVFSGSLYAKRCGNYTVKVGFDPRQPRKPEHAEQ